MSNKYLTKIAYYSDYSGHTTSTNYNINDNYIHDPYKDRLLDRIETVSSGNKNLVRYGYKPSIEETSHGEIDAETLNNHVRQQGYRPHQASSTTLGVLGGLATGGLTGLGVGGLINRAKGYQHLAPLGGTVAGVGAGVVAGKALYKHLYSDTKRTKDDETVETNKNALLDHLASRYQKESYNNG